MIRLSVAAAILFLAVPAGAETFGAVSYSFKENKFGRSWDYSSREEAQAAATGFCIAEGGADCAAALFVQDSCGAVARADGTSQISQMGISWGFDSEEASRPRALAECEANNPGEACWIVASVCSQQQ